MSATPAPPAGGNESITVVVRCRPMNRKETEDKRQNVVDIDSELRQVSIRSLTAGDDPKSFTFDAAYDENTQQRIFYEESCFSIIECALEGFNATIFAYGQTGCGKSFTMQGPSTTDEEMRGVIPNSFYHIFQFVKSTKDVEFLIRCSYLELYNEEIRDLLANQKNPAKCELKEDPGKGVYVKGLSDVVVESPDDLVKMFDRGLTNRTTASTNMNAESSRSHSVFSVIIEMSTKDAMTGKDMLRVGKLNLVDLAGSERAKKTGAKDQTLKEGIKINLSLAALGNVISALSEGGRHIPYRDSKLTRLLQDSLGGNAKTMMVAAISPADYNHEETISTLRYANRAKNIKNKPKINEDPKDTMIREFKAEIERLKALLMQQQTGGAGAGDILAQLSGAMAGAMAIASNSSNAADTLESHSPKSNRSAAVPQKAAAKSAKSPPKQVDQREEENEQQLAEPYAVETRKDMTETTYTNYENEDFEVSQSEHNSPTKPTQQSQQLSNTQASDDGGYADNDFDEGDEVAAAAEIRDEIEQRIHQLEHMLVHNSDDSATTAPSTSQPGVNPNGSNKHANQSATNTSEAAGGTAPSTTTTSAAEVNTELSAADQAKEAEALRLYKERKQKAKVKRDEKQKRELQRILDEKKAMEEELEELRSSTAQNNQTSPLNLQSEDNSSNNNSNTAAMYDKKIQKLRKKYEKKATALKEELDEVREDFSYQRKQLMDAVVEQEKDTKLYELLCKALLGEKELQKLLDKARYDEDADEWILPYVKRKHLDNDISSSAGGNSSNQYPGSLSSRVGSGQGPANGGPSAGGVGSKLLPDILPVGKANNSNGGMNLNNFNPGQLQQLQPHPPSNTGKAKKRNNHQGNNGSSSSGSHGKGKVPLLTLPGALVSVAALAHNDEEDNDPYPDAFKYNGNHQFSHQQQVPMYSSRSELGQDNNNGNSSYAGNNSSRGQQQPLLSLPGINTHGNNSHLQQQQSHVSAEEDVGVKRKKTKVGGGGGGALRRSQEDQTAGGSNDEYQSGNSSNNASYHGKMPAIGSSNNNSNHNALASGIADSRLYGGGAGGSAEASLRLDQAGSGQHAGPVDEWGFQVNKRSSAGGGGGAGGGASEPWSDVGAHESYADYFDEDNSPELEYSDDEDFVSSAVNNNKKKSTDTGDNNNSTNNKATQKKKKKKNQQRQARNSRDGLVEGDFSLGSGGGGGGGGGLPPITNATPRQPLLGGGGLSLPPI